MGIKRALWRLGAWGAFAVAAAVWVGGCYIEGDREAAPIPTPVPTVYYTLATDVEPYATGYVVRSVDESRYKAGTVVTLTAKANTGYYFIGWTGALASKDESVTVTMNAGISLIANFRRQGAIAVPGDTTDTFIATDSTLTMRGLTWMRQNVNINAPSSWCYGGDPAYCAEYGRLYTWEAAKAVCAGMGGSWRLPTRGEWDILLAFAGGAGVAGKKLKSESGWNSDGGGTDDYGFSALPGGGRGHGAGDYGNVGNYGFWWSATEGVDGDGVAYAYGRYIYYGVDGVIEHGNHLGDGLSVRCVKSKSTN